MFAPITLPARIRDSLRNQAITLKTPSQRSMSAVSALAVLLWNGTDGGGDSETSSGKSQLRPFSRSIFLNKH